MNKILLSIVASVILLSANSVKAEELITNGSFEDGTTNWTCGYQDSCITFSNDDGVGKAKDGTQWYYLSPDGLSNSFETIKQTITIPADAKSLVLKFNYKFYLEEDESLNDGFFGVSLDSTDGNKTYFDDFFGDNEERSKWGQYTKIINDDLAGKTITLEFFASADWPWSVSADIDAISLQSYRKYKLAKPTGLDPWIFYGYSGNVYWDEVAKAQSYKVELRKSENNEPINKWKNIEKSSLDIYSYLAADTAYKFRVKACRGSNCGEWSDYKKFNTN